MFDKELKILHVSSHYGGGVSTIINSLLKHDTENIHTLTFLNDIPINHKENHYLFDVDMISHHDIVIVHVFNHPALFEFLTRVKLPECRLIGWSHMAGNHAPYVLFDKLKNYFDEFYYTSPVSGTDRDFIWSSCDINKFLSIKKKAHSGFNVGYVGTLDFCKLHPDFIKICSEIDIPDVRFIIVGHGCDREIMKQQAIAYGIDHKVDFTGIVSDTTEFLALFDVFMYPLNENHEGTCEQVLGESMAVGIPVVVLNNAAERIIIKDGKNGFICKNKKDIPEKIKNIYEKKIKLSEKKIKRSAKKIYSVEKKIKAWNKVFKRVIKNKKRFREWSNESNSIFIESLGPDSPESKIFKEYIRHDFFGNDYDLHNYAIPKMKRLFRSSKQWSSKSKGSVIQYSEYFPDDKYLKKWRKILDEK